MQSDHEWGAVSMRNKKIWCFLMVMLWIAAVSSSFAASDLSDEKSALTIKGMFWPWDDADFQTAHPEIELTRQVEYNPFCASDAYNEILAGDTGADLYFVAYSSELQELIDQGHIAPLTSSQTLMADHQRLYPVFADAIMHDGELYAVPAYVEYGHWKAEVTAAQKVTMPGTLSEMLSLLVSWKEQKENAGQACLGLVVEYREWTALDWLDMAMYQFLMASIEQPQPDVVNCKELLEIMTEVKSCYVDAGLPLLPDDARKISYEEPAAIMAYGGNRGYYGISMEAISNHPYTYDPIKQPTLFSSLEQKYPAVMMVYVLNPNSQHKEEALAYLEWMAQNRPIQDAAWLQQDSEAQLIPSEYLSSLPEGEKKEDELARRNNWLVYGPHLQFYREEILPQLTLLTTPLLERQRMISQPVYPEILTQFSQYLTDEQSAEQCLVQIQEIVDTHWTVKP